MRLARQACSPDRDQGCVVRAPGEDPMDLPRLGEITERPFGARGDSSS